MVIQHICIDALENKTIAEKKEQCRENYNELKSGLLSYPMENCFKLFYRQMYKDFQYSKNEVDTEFFDIKNYEDPDERYYACVVDKNRAGAKPKLLFNLNLAYNRWVELGYLSLKQSEENMD